MTTQQQLLQFMQQISQRCTGKEWAENLEWKLWFAVRSDGEVKWGKSVITKEELIKLNQLYVQAQGWWTKVDGELKFLPPLEWVRRYKAADPDHIG